MNRPSRGQPRSGFLISTDFGAMPMQSNGKGTRFPCAAKAERERMQWVVHVMTRTTAAFCSSPRPLYWSLLVADEG